MYCSWKDVFELALGDIKWFHRSTFSHPLQPPLEYSSSYYCLPSPELARELQALTWFPRPPSSLLVYLKCRAVGLNKNRTGRQPGLSTPHQASLEMQDGSERGALCICVSIKRDGAQGKQITLCISVAKSKIFICCFWARLQFCREELICSVWLCVWAPQCVWAEWRTKTEMFVLEASLFHSGLLCVFPRILLFYICLFCPLALLLLCQVFIFPFE